MTLFERDESAGGLVRFGVPDFKIEKWVVQRRVEQLIAERAAAEAAASNGGSPASNGGSAAHAAAAKKVG